MFSIFFVIKMFSGTDDSISDESLRPARFPPLMRTKKRKSQYSTDEPGGKKACGTSTSSAGGTRTNNRPGHPTGLSMMNNPYNTCYASCAGSSGHYAGDGSGGDVPPSGSGECGTPAGGGGGTPAGGGGGTPAGGGGDTPAGGGGDTPAGGGGDTPAGGGGELSTSRGPGHISGLGQMKNPGDSCFSVAVVQALTEVQYDQHIDLDKASTVEQLELIQTFSNMARRRRNPEAGPFSPTPLLIALNRCLSISDQYGMRLVHETGEIVPKSACAIELLNDLLAKMVATNGFIVNHIEHGDCDKCGCGATEVMTQS
jgi:hypothetical protein